MLHGISEILCKKLSISLGGKCVDNAKNMTDKSEDNDIMLKELIEKYANDIVDACRLVLRISVMSSA